MNNTLKIFLRPLDVVEWEPEFSGSGLPENPTPERLLEFLCSLGSSSDMSAFKKRYTDLSEKDYKVLFSIREGGLEENLHGPLRQAKTNYVSGNYLGSIALCGIVAEKVAILLFNANVASENRRRKFQGCGQKGRIKTLKNKGLIDDKIEVCFNDIKHIRDEYLHRWNDWEDFLSKRAAEAYAAAQRLVYAVIVYDIANGAIVLNPKLMEYIWNNEN